MSWYINDRSFFLVVVVVVGGLVAKSCPTPLTPMDCSPPDSSVNGIL